MVASGEQVTLDLEFAVALSETDSVLVNVDGTKTEQARIAVLRSILSASDQVFSGLVTALKFSGDGSLLTNIVSTGVGGTSSVGSLSLVCNSGGANPGSEIAWFKDGLLLGSFDENGFSPATGIPYSHADASIPFAKNINLAGKGIDFGVSVLDDYEEGDWTITIASGITGITYTNQTGHYIKKGNEVTITGRLAISAGTPDANAFQMSGLPFVTSSNASGRGVGGVMFFTHAGEPANSSGYLIFPSATSTNFSLYANTTGGGGRVSFKGNDVGATVDIEFSLVYFVD